MAYCPNCGNEVDHEISPEERAIRDAVEIARINADRDIQIARLQARQQREELETAEHVAETEAEAEVGAAFAEAEVLATTLEAGVTEEEPAPVIVDAPAEEPEDDMVPPEAEHEEHREGRKRVGLGVW